MAARRVLYDKPEDLECLKKIFTLREKRFARFVKAAVIAMDRVNKEQMRALNVLNKIFGGGRGPAMRATKVIRGGKKTTRNESSDFFRSVQRLIEEEESAYFRNERPRSRIAKKKIRGGSAKKHK